MRNPFRRKQYRVSFTTESAVRAQLRPSMDERVDSGISAFILKPMHSEWATFDSARSTALGLAAAGYYDVALEADS